MKTIIIIAILITSVSVAQESKNKSTTPQKPSTTDCPTWNKKKTTSNKANYFQFLQTNKPNQLNTTSKTTASKSQPYETPSQTKSTETIPNKKQTSETSKSEALYTKPEMLLKRKTEIPAKTTQAHSENSESIYTQDNKLANINKNEALTEQKPSNTANDSTKSSISKQKTEPSKLEQKLSRLTRKTTKVRKHSNAKCPSF